MKINLASLCFGLCLAGLFAAGARAQERTADTASAVLGDWRGTSLCLVKPSACHDEEALYHLNAAPDKPGKLFLQADKIVDGHPVTMGTSDCSFDAAKKILHCDLGKGYVELTLVGDRLEGTMFLADKTRWREIKLTRIKS
ncbi:MAG TPA: hypothetical protein VJW20_10660 [Candidatus Angelobacter sp.]|nr:hypothetical protein [Candidatus Angelobacter sp.]